MRKPLSVNFDDLFGEFFEEIFGNAHLTTGSDALPCDEYLEADHYILEIAAAGFLKREIEVQVDNRALSISIAHSNDTASEVTKKFITKRIAQRSFRLSKLIPPEYNLDEIMCTFKDGLLRIVIPPKKEAQTVKNIAIN